MFNNANDFNKQVNTLIWQGISSIVKKMKELKTAKFLFQHEINGNLQNDMTIKMKGIEIIGEEVYYFGDVVYKNGNTVFGQSGNIQICSNREAIIAHCLTELESFLKKRLDATKLISSDKVKSVLDDITGKGKAQIRSFLMNQPEGKFKLSSPVMVPYEYKFNTYICWIYLDDGIIMCELHIEVENNKQVRFDELNCPIYVIVTILKEIENSLGIYI